MIADEAPDKDRLAIPDTRPNMLLFVPYELAVLFGIIGVATDVQLHSLLDGAVVIPLWVLAAVLVRRDVNGVRVFFVRLRLVTLLRDASRWGGLTVSPWPLKAKGRRDAV